MNSIKSMMLNFNALIKEYGGGEKKRFRLEFNILIEACFV